MRNLNRVATLILISVFLLTAGCAGGRYYTGQKSDIVKKFNKGKSLYEKEKYPEAREYFQKVIKTDPNSPLYDVSMYYLGSSYKKEKDYAKAKSIFSELISKRASGFWVDMAKKDLKEINK